MGILWTLQRRSVVTLLPAEDAAGEGVDAGDEAEAGKELH